jgi:hypothetical protein
MAQDFSQNRGRNNDRIGICQLQLQISNSYLFTKKQSFVETIKTKTADQLDEKERSIKDGFHQWALEMGLGKPILYYEHPDGKRKADEIMSKVGLKPKITLSDVFNGDKSLNEFFNQ